MRFDWNLDCHMSSFTASFTDTFPNLLGLNASREWAYKSQGILNSEMAFKNPYIGDFLIC